MARRQQVQYEPPGANLRPAASPVVTPFVPRLAKPALLPVQELAGLSEALTNIAFEQQKKENAASYDAGTLAGLGAPRDLVDEIGAAGAGLEQADQKAKANQDAFAKAVADGRIHVSQDPWARVGYMQGMSQQIMQRYEGDLQARMAQVTATVDEHGNPVIAADPQAVAQEVWQKYQGNAILNDRFGQQVAVKAKQEIDARFVTQAQRKLGEEQSKATLKWGENTLAEKFVTLSATGSTPTPEQFEEVRGFQTELRRKTGQDVNAAVMGAVKGAAAQVDADDDGHSGVSKAANLLRELRKSPIGNTTIEKDADAGPVLESMIRQYDALHEQKADDSARKQANEQKLAVGQAEKEFFTLVDEEMTKGNGDVLGVAGQLAQRYRETDAFGDNTGVVIDRIQGIALSKQVQNSSVEIGRVIREIQTSPDPDLAYQSVETLTGAGMLTFGDILKARAAYEERKSTENLVEKSPQSRQMLEDLNKVAAIEGVPADVGAAVRIANRDLVDDYVAREQAAATAALKLPKEQQDQAMQEWRDKNGAELKKGLAQANLDFIRTRDQAIEEADQALYQATSPEQVLRKYPQYFSAEQRRDYMQRGAIASDREQYTLSAPYVSEFAFIEQKVKDKYAKANPEQLADLLKVAEAEFHDQFVSALDEKLPGAKPNQRMAVIRQAALDVSPKVLENLATSNVARLQQGIQPGGEGAAKTVEVLETAATSLGSAERLAGMDRQAQGDALAASPDLNVSEDLKELNGRLVSRQGVFSKVRRDDVVDRAYVEIQKTIADPKLDDRAKAQAAIDSLRVTGIPAEQLLSGKVEIGPSDAWKRKAREWADRYAAQGAYVPLIDPAGRLSIVSRATLEAELAKPPIVVDISKAKVPIYELPAFRTPAELQDWRENRPDELRALATKYGVPDGKPEFKKWLRYQFEAVTRGNQNE